MLKVKVVGLRAPHRGYFSLVGKVTKSTLKGAFAPFRIPKNMKVKGVDKPTATPNRTALPSRAPPALCIHGWDSAYLYRFTPIGRGSSIAQHSTGAKKVKPTAPQDS